jgi:hypothetical protein
MAGALSCAKCEVKDLVHFREDLLDRRLTDSLCGNFSPVSKLEALKGFVQDRKAFDNVDADHCIPACVVVAPSKIQIPRIIEARMVRPPLACANAQYAA